MAHISIVKRWFNAGLWVLGLLVGFSLFSSWDAYQEIDFGQDERNRFVLAVIITSGLIAAWGWLIVAKQFVKHFMRPSRVVRGWRSHVPWWLVQILFLLVVAVSMGITISKLSLEMTSEFGLLKKDNYTELQRRIIKYNPILNVVDKESGLTLMQMAFLKNDLRAIRLFAQYGADPLTVLTLDDFSAFAYNPEIIKVLLEHKMNPNAADSNGIPLLFYTVKMRNVVGLDLLLKAGANPEKSGSDIAPLIVAVQDENQEIVRLLVEYKANLNVQNEQGNTALHICVQRDDLQLLRFLLENGANARVFNKSDLTPVHLAARIGSIKSLEVFLEHDPELVHLRSEQADRTPFTDAIRGDHYDAARLLLKNGAKIDRVLKSGFTVLHSMLISQQFENAVFLVKEGADIHVVCKSVYAGVNEKGETAYHFMRRKKMRKLLKLVDQRDGTKSFYHKEDETEEQSEKSKKRKKELPPIL